MSVDLMFIWKKIRRLPFISCLRSAKSEPSGWRIHKLVPLLLCVFFLGTKAEATGFSDLPGYRVSPDGKAWTYEEAVREEKLGSTAVVSKTVFVPRQPKEYEHEYTSLRREEIAVGSWICTWPRAMCIHSLRAITWHNLPQSAGNCHKRYYPGWMCICADCGEQITNHLFYLSRDVVLAADSVNTTLDYYFCCPFCRNPELAYNEVGHLCKRISVNRYRVEYHTGDSSVLGKVPASYHTYNNEEWYEGRFQTAQKNLNTLYDPATGKPRMVRQGYRLEGWATTENGPVVYRDGDLIKNLTTKEETVHLYAVWTKVESSVTITDYKGMQLTYKGCVGETIRIESEKLTMPVPFRVEFRDEGKTFQKDAMLEITGFDAKGEQTGTFQKKNGEWWYTFGGPFRYEERFTVAYGNPFVKLPNGGTDAGYFTGWYRDENRQLFAGATGEICYCSHGDVFYGETVKLMLSAREGDEPGTIDLFWESRGREQRYYKVYGGEAGSELRQIDAVTGQSVTVGQTAETVYRVAGRVRHAVPQTGFYKLSLAGAGSLAREVEGSLFLKKGEVVEAQLGKMGSTSFEGEDSYLSAGGREWMQAPGGKCLEKPILHNHAVSSCAYHTHVGNDLTGGSCYETKAVTSCGTFFARCDYYYGWWRYDEDTTKPCTQCGVMLANHPTDHPAYTWICQTCGYQTRINPGNVHYRDTYLLSCDLQEGYICGFTEEELDPYLTGFEDVTPKGSTSASFFSVREAKRVQEENSCLTIRLLDSGYLMQEELRGVYAGDEQAPIEVDLETAGCYEQNGERYLIFKPTTDVGSCWQFQVTGQYIRPEGGACKSNLLTYENKSGLVGYYYKISDVASDSVSSRDLFTSQAQVNVTGAKEGAFLHLAPVDAAGNLGPVSHLCLQNLDRYEKAVELYRLREPHAGNFRSGDAGEVLITVDSPAERLRICFPGEDWTGEGSFEVYASVTPHEVCHVTIPFAVPLGALDGAYAVRVDFTDKHGEEVLSPETRIVTVKGKITDELHTRLR